MEATLQSPSTAPVKPTLAEWKAWFLEGGFGLRVGPGYETGCRGSICTCCGSFRFSKKCIHTPAMAKYICFGENMTVEELLTISGLHPDGKHAIGTHSFTDDDGAVYSFAWRDV